LTKPEFHVILNYKMTNVGPQSKFIQPFSRGQVTIPKDYREYLGINEESWLKISLLDDQILIQPVKDTKESRVVKPKISREAYLKKLLKIKGAWFNKKGIDEVRTEIEERLAKNEKAFT